MSGWVRAAAPVPWIAGGSEPSPPVTTAGVLDALGGVVDPELAMSVVELGLIYDIAVAAGTVHITMTLTAPGCPLHAVMPEWVRQAVEALPGVERVEVTLTFDPPWTAARIGRGPGRRR